MRSPYFAARYPHFGHYENVPVIGYCEFDMCSRSVIFIYLMLSAIVIYLEKNLAHGDVNPYVEALRARPWKSIQRYVEVRPGAFLFYWLYYADGTAAGADLKPLVIWIQGGPGFAATGLANFAELGPLDMNFQPRNYTWVKGRNVLLIDHPVGAGFSYVKDQSLLVSNDREMALDLSRAIKAFLRKHKEFRKSPTYIIGQSYGGKICPRLAYYLHNAIQRKRLKMNFEGIGIGGGWVDPKESILVHPEYLYNMGVIDQSTYLKTKSWSRNVANSIEKKQYPVAWKIHNILFATLSDEAGMVINFNNLNQVSPYPALKDLAVKVNRYVKPTLAHVVNQTLVWKYMAEDVWQNMNRSFLVPSTKFLETILNDTNLTVAIYNGNLDVITPLAGKTMFPSEAGVNKSWKLGASNWAHKLKWPGAQEFKEATRTPILGMRNGLYKTAQRLSFWWVFGAGHWVPEDNPVAMRKILDFMMEKN